MTDPLVGGLAALALMLQPSSDACAMAESDRAWTVRLAANWRAVSETVLGLAPEPGPSVVVFDAACVHRFAADADHPHASAAHDGGVALPGGQTVPPVPLAFAAPDDQGGAFFVLALPSVWRAHEADMDLERLLPAVALHEISHTRQVRGLGRRIDDLIARGVLSEDVDDDILQSRFGGDPDYTAAMAAEIERLYAAAWAADAGETRRLAGEALAMLDARRARWLTGADIGLLEAEDVFLTFEGAGNWVAWAWLRDAAGGGLSDLEAADMIRGGRAKWSQEAGLALFLALDRLDPSWRPRVYGDDPALAVDLLREAVGRP